MLANILMFNLGVACIGILTILGTLVYERFKKRVTEDGQSHDTERAVSKR